MSQYGFPGAEWYPGMYDVPKNPGTGRWDKDGHALPIRYIVIHGTNALAQLQWWIDHAATVCAVHYMIGKDGRIAQFRKDLDNHWGNGVVSDGHEAFWDQYKYVNAKGEDAWYSNEVSLSIEHVKTVKNNNEPLTPAQVSSSFALVSWLCRMYDIPMRYGDADGGIVPHSSVNPVWRSFCPGPYPWSDLFSAITRSQYYIPSGWRDIANSLVAA